MNLKQLIPAPWKPGLHAALDSALDAADRFKPHDMYTPPRPLQRLVGDGDFRAAGNSIVGDLKRYVDLQPSDRVLDVGCGIGRIAVPLTEYLTSPYEGFDIMKVAIDWCQAQIAPRFPHFHFQHADIYSEYYNPRGPLRAGEFVFPFDDESFDVVFLASVFTHLLPPDVAHYMGEISRVLKPGGRCLATIFLLNEASLPEVDSGRAVFCPKYEMDGARVRNVDSPEEVVAHYETSFRQICAPLPLLIEVSYGSWTRAFDSPHGHDYIIMEKLPVGVKVGT